MIISKFQKRKPGDKTFPQGRLSSRRVVKSELSLTMVKINMGRIND